LKTEQLKANMQLKNCRPKPGESLGEAKEPGREEARTDEARSSHAQAKYRAIKRHGEIVQ